MTKRQLKQLYNKPSAYDLLYPVYHENGVFLLLDGSVGQMWELTGVSIDGKSASNLTQISNAFANFISALPENTPIQFICVSVPGAESIETYINGDMSNQYVHDYVHRKIWWHNQCKHKGFAKVGNKFFAPRTIKMYITIKQNPLGIKGLNLYDEASFKKTVARLKSTEIRVETSLSAGGFIAKKVTNAQHLIDIMYKILNPNSAVDIQPPEYRGGDMRQYFLRNSIELVEDGVITEGVKYNVISLANAPARASTVEEEDKGLSLYTYPNILFGNNGETNIFDFTSTLLYTCNFYIPSQDALSRSLNMKKTLSFLHRFNFIGDVSVDKEIARKDTTRAITLMYEGKKMVRGSFHFCIPTSLAGATDNVVSQLISFLNISSSCNAFRENLIGHGIFMRSLPFGFDHKMPEEEKYIRRAITISAHNLADISPIYCTSRGVKTNVAAGYYNRLGESLWLDLFDKDTSITSPHCLITGATGAGKSVTTVDFISQILRQPATVVVIDKGNSYKRLCMLNKDKGQYLSFEGDTDYILDPFMGDWSDDHRAFLVALVSMMCSGGTETITREEISVISEAVFKLKDVSRKGLPRLVEILNENGDEISKSLARKLYPYYGNGQYAKIIEGDKPKLQLSKQLTVFELGDVDTYADYQALIVFLLIFYITEYMKKTPGRKYLFIDEAWSLFKNPFAVDFLIKAVKTFRKLGCSIVFITQQLDDFMVIARAMNMKDNCPNKILLYQETDVVTKNADMLELSEGEIELYKTIRKSKKYAEAMIKTQQWTAVGRITLDPKSYWIATTSESDTRYLNSLIQNGMTLEEAIDYASEKYPYGYA